MRKILSVLLTVCILLSTLAVFPITTGAEVTDSGTCGDNLTWEYDSSTYTLTISGTGGMENYNRSRYDGIAITTAPWSPYYNTMKTVIIRDGVANVGDNAFYNCTNLSSVKMGNSLKSIGCTAFGKCTGLTSITIGNSVENIESRAFVYCTNLVSVTVYDSIKYISDMAFDHCDNLKYNSYDNALYLGNKNNPYTVLMKAVSKDISSCDIADTTNLINFGAFSDCKNITSIMIPDSVTVIGGSAFTYCQNLTSVVMGSCVADIENRGFYNCVKLNDIYYRSSYEKWSKIIIKEDNNELLKANIRYGLVGDVNKDGEIGVGDVVMLRRYLSGSDKELADKVLADFNGDGKVNAKDLLALRILLAS